MRLGRLPDAAAAFERASRLRPDVVPPLVNAAIVYARMGQTAQAEKALRQALEAEPRCASANFNLGLLLAEKADRAGAVKALRLALEIDPKHAAAAYNLGVLMSERDLDTCLMYCRKAWSLAPEEPKYAWTYGFFLRKAKQADYAITVLQSCIRRDPAHVQVYELLGDIYEERQDVDAARDVYMKAARNPNLPQPIRSRFAFRAENLRGK
jgi:tetratricopeptide (TPR) repeat protein